MAGSPKSRERTADVRLFANVGGAVLIAFALVTLVVAYLTAQIGYDDFSAVQFLIGMACSVAIAAAAISCWIFAAGTGGRRPIALSLALAIVAFAVWQYGFSAWCTGCGVP